MDVPRRIELPFRVRFDESGPDGLVRDSSLLRYVQETAWVHSESAGFDRAWYRSRGLTWLVRGVAVTVLASTEHGDALHVSTEVAGWRRVWARRLSEVTGPAADLRAVIQIDWVLVGPRGTPVRVPPEIAQIFNARDIGSFEPARATLPHTPADATTLAFTVPARDVDPMAHVNNAVYLDYAHEAIAASGPAARAALAALPRTWLAEFVRPAPVGDRLTGCAWRDDGDWAYRLLGPSGDEVFRTRLKTAS